MQIAIVERDKKIYELAKRGKTVEEIQEWIRQEYGKSLTRCSIHRIVRNFNK
ncbi:MAG: hypothetical protein BWY74_00336 [Firmicutes bacterium ADurb.Bin419]|nr:MAG: hypothetical protein BWY74_00336 [Firmicutes bacterium ADurb.Bin419]